MLGLEVGQVRYGPFCDENGKMVGDGTVFKFADDHAWAITALDSDLDHIHEVVKGIDVAIEPVTEQLPHLQLQGPRSRELLAGLTDADVAGLRYFRFWPDQVEVGGVPCWVSRTGYSGEVGYELFCTPERRRGARGPPSREPVRSPYGLAAVETIRIESGLIFIGYDYFQHETRSVRHEPRQGDPPGHGGFPRQTGARRNGEGAAAPLRDPRRRRQRGSRVRRGRDRRTASRPGR